MVDITHKTETLRTARACAVLQCSEPTALAVKNKTIAKGDVAEAARIAGLMAAKNTQHILPHCHPVSIDHLEITVSVSKDHLYFEVLGKSLGRTGIEMECLTAASVAALTAYDMLKPVDKTLEIHGVKLLEKTGGKSSNKYFNSPPICAVLVCSDSTAEGKREDASGKKIQDLLLTVGAEVIDYRIVPDEKHAIQQQIKDWVTQDIHFIFTTGGTGLGPRDHTVSAVEEILERDAPGIAEAMRHHGQQRTPLAMMSRGVAGSIGHTTIVTLPGSTAGATECLQALLPALFHARKMLKGGGH